MYIAMHDEETTYIGVTIRDCISGEQETFEEEENLPIARGKRGEGIMVATGECCAGTDMILEKAKKLSGKITAERMIGEIEPMVRACHDFYDQTEKDGTYKTNVIVGTKDGLYEIDGAVAKPDFAVSDYYLTCRGAYLASKGTTVERLLYVYRTVERMQGVTLFPVSVYDVRTGKRRVFIK